MDSARKIELAVENVAAHVVAVDSIQGLLALAARLASASEIDPDEFVRMVFDAIEAEGGRDPFKPRHQP